MGPWGDGDVARSTALTPEPVSVQSLDSCMELDSLRERMQRIHVETEGREETRLLQQDREEGEGQGAEVGVQDGRSYGISGSCSPMSILIFSVMYGSDTRSWDAGGRGGRQGSGTSQRCQAKPSFQHLLQLGTGQLSIALTCLQGFPLLQILTGKSPVPPILHATCRTLTLDTRTLPGVTTIRRRYSESR